jgi:hypothetical protein
MSAIQFLISGGMASIGGDLPDEERKTINEVIKNFGKKVKDYAISLQVPASVLKVQQCTYLFIGKDTSHYHIVFADGPGSTSLNYRDFTSRGRLELQSIVHQVRIEVGEVAWAFSYPLNLPPTELDNYIQNIVVQYVNTVLQFQQKPKKEISDEAISNPEIASGLEKFKTDYPIGSKTAFIVMQFEGTKPHKGIVACIKNTLKKYKIEALRADDKQYMDDLFPNVKVYMHGCDFGLAVFDRITEDDFNPNVSLEVGYMLGMGKDVLLLKDKTLKSLPTDLTGKLYKEFDTTDIESTMPQQIDKWLSDKGIK